MITRGRLLIFGLTFMFVVSASANPTGGVVASGDVQITQQANQTVIQQNSQKAIINWQTFNINAGEKTHFQQPQGGVALNRINAGQGPSQIYGQLTATGKIILVNQSGIFFGPGSYVNVGGIIASTTGISDQNFLAGKLIFDQPSLFNGSVINKGTIIAADNGLVALIGTGVSNEGYIQARTGNVVLASGNKFTLDLYGDQLINFAIDEATPNAGVDQNGNPLKNAVNNSGTVMADGGTVMMSAKSASQVLDHVINMDGVVQANSVSQKNGVIILGTGTEKSVRVTGKIYASGKKSGEKGGKVKVLAKEVTSLEGSAEIDVSGDAGGGEILIGGNYQGKGPELNSLNTFVGSGVKLNADALTNGDGGRVIAWADKATLFYGDVTAKGGMLGGNGGFIETSGHEYLDINGARVNLLAPNGTVGTWLLDPRDVTISSATTSGGAYDGLSPTNTFTPTSDSSVVNISTLVSNLGSANVNITTGSTGIQNGDITVLNNISWSSANSLTLTAARNIFINGAITIGNASANLILNAVGDVTQVLSATIAGSGGVIKQGAGTAYFSQANTYTGLTTISSGTVSLQNNSGLGSTSGGTQVASGATLAINGSGLNISEDITSLSGTFKNLANSNTYQGNITLGAGGGTITSDAGTLTLSNAIISGTGLTLTVNGAGNTVLGDILTGSGGVLTKNGTGTLELTSANSTYTGLTNVNSGILKISAASNVLGTSAAGTVVADGATLQTSVIGSVAEPITITGDGVNGTTGAIYNTSSISLSGAITLGGTGARINSNAGLFINGGVTGSGSQQLRLGVLGSNGITIANNGISIPSGSVLIDGSGNGVVYYQVANSYTGLTTVTSGTLSVETSAAINGGALTVNGSSAIIDLVNSNVTSSLVTVMGGGSITSTNGTIQSGSTFDLRSGSISAIIAGSSSLNKTTSGTISLTRANTYTGLTTVSAGILGIQNSTALGTTGSGTTVASGATLRINGNGLAVAEPITLAGTVSNLANNNTISGAITLSGSAGVINSDAGILSITGGVTGSGLDLGVSGSGNVSVTTTPIATGIGALNKNGSGTLTLGVGNTFTGLTTVNAGTVAANVANSLASGNNLTIAGGTFDASTFNQTLGTVILSSGTLSGTTGVITGTSYDMRSGTASAILGGTGAVLTKTTSGTVTLSGNNTYTGATNVNAGTLAVSANNALGTTASGTTIASGAILDFQGVTYSTLEGLTSNGGTIATSTGTSSFSGPISLTSATTTTFSIDGTQLTLLGALSSSGGLIKSGLGTLTLGVANTFTGLTTVNAGTVAANVSNALTSGNNLTIAGGTFNTSTFNQTLGTVILSSGALSGTTGVITGTSYDMRSGTASAILGGTGAVLTKTTSGTVTLSGNNTYTGATNVNAGTLAVSTNNALGTTASGTTIASGAILDFQGVTYSTLEGITSNGGTIATSTGTSSFSGAISLTNATTTTFTIDGTQLALLGALSGSGSLVKNGNNVLIFGVDNSSYTGAISINIGTLRVGNGGASGTLGSGAVTNNDTLVFNRTSDLDVTNVISGSGSITQQNASNQIILSGNNSYSGVTNVSAGRLKANHANALGSTLGNTVVTSGARLIIGDGIALAAEPISIAGVGPGTGRGALTGGVGSSMSGSVTLTGAAKIGTELTGGSFTLNGSTISGEFDLTLTTENAGDTGIINSAINIGAGNLIKINSGTWTLAANNSYTGTTTISAGTLRIGNSGSSGTLGSGAVSNSGALIFNRSSDLDVTNAISGTGTIEQLNGSNQITLSGNNNYSGVTTVSAGRLKANNANALGTTAGNTVVVSGARLIIGDGIALAAEPISIAGVGPGTGRGALTGGIGSSISGPVTLTAAAKIGTELAGGSFTLASGSTITGAFDLTLTTENAGDTGIINSAINIGTGNLIKINSGTWTLAGSNSYTGTTTISAGTLALSGSGSIASSSKVNVSAGTFSISGTTSGASIISLLGSSSVVLGSKTLTITNAADNFTGVLSGTGGSLNLTGGSLGLGGANTYTGSTTVSNSILSYLADNVISDSSAVTIDGGSATLFLSDYSDTLASLTVKNNASVLGGLGALTVNSGTGSFALESGNISAVLSGTAALNKTTSGTLTLSNTNNYSGLTTVNGGILSYGTNNVLGSGDLTVTSGTLDLGANRTDTVGTITLNGGSIIGTGTSALTSTGTFEMQSGSASVIFSGTGALNKTTSGTVTLSGVNNYSGLTTINGGTLSYGANDVLGSGGLTVTSGTLDLGANRTDAVGTITLNGGSIVGTGTSALTSTGTFEMQSGSASVIFSGTGALNKTTSGTVTLSGASNYSGLTTINGGTLAYGGNNALGSGGLTVTSGTLDLGANRTDTVGTITLNGGSILGTGTSALTSTGTFEMQSGSASAIFSGTGALNKTTSGTVTLSGANNYSGLTTINGGTLSYGANDVLGSGGLTVTSGTLDLGASHADTVGTITLNGGSIVGTGTSALTSTGTFEMQSGSASVIFSGTGALNKTTSGTVTLSGASNYSGLTTINGGTLVYGGNNALGSGGVTITNATLDLGANHTDTVGTITLNGGSILGTGTSALTSTGTFEMQSGSVSSILSGSGIALNKTGLGTMILSGDNTYTGVTTISAGTLQIGNGGSTGSLGTGAVVNSGDLNFNLTSNVTVANAISGAGTVTQNGSNTVTLTGNNTYSGKTTINAGSTLRIGSGGTTGSLGSGSVDVLGTLMFNRSDAITIPNLFSYNGQVVQAGTGVLSLTGDNQFLGSYVINSGSTFQLGNGSGGANLTRSDITANITNNGSFIFNLGSADYSRVIYIDGTGSVTKNGTGIVTMSGNNYSGNTIINQGVLSLTGGAAEGLPYSSVIINGSNSYLDLSLYASNINLKSLSGDGSILLINNGNTPQLIISDGAGYTFSGSVGGGGGITLSSGELTLSGLSSYTGSTIVNGGTLIINTIANPGTSSSIGSGSTQISIGSGATLKYIGSGSSSSRTIRLLGNNAVVDASGSGALTLSGGVTSSTAGYNLILTGSGSASQSGNITTGSGGGLTKNGSGTWTLSGLNTFTGQSTINSGILSINSITNVNGGASALGNASSIANGTISLNGGTLRYTGTGSSSDRAISLTGSSTLDTSGSGALVLGGNVTGSGTLILKGNALGTLNGNINLGSGSIEKYDGSTWTLSGNNIFGSPGAGLSIYGGRLNAASSNALGSELTYVSSGTTLGLTGNSSINIGNEIWLEAGAMLSSEATANTSISSIISMINAGNTIIQANNNLSINGGIAFIIPDETGLGLTLQGTGSVTLNGTIYNTLNNIQSSVATTFTSNIANVTTSGIQSYTGGVTLSGSSIGFNSTNSAIAFSSMTSSANTALSVSSGTGGISFSGSVGSNGARLGAMTLNTSGNTTLGGTIYADSLTTDASGSGRTIINGSGVTTTNAQTYNDTVDIGSAVTLAGVNISIGSINATGAGSALTINSSSTSTINAYNESGVSTGSTLAKSGAGILIMSSSSNYSGGTAINTGTIRVNNANSLGAGNVVVNSGGRLQLNTASFANNISAAGTGTSGVGAISTTGSGTRTLSGAITLTGDSSFIANSGSTLAITGAINGANALSITGSGNVDLQSSNIGLSTKLSSLTVSTTGTLDLHNVETTGAQTYTGSSISAHSDYLALTGDITFNSPITLISDTTMTASAGHVYLGAVDGANALAITSSAGASLGGAMGGSTPLTSLSVTGPVSIGANVSTSGSQSYASAATLIGNTVLTSSAGSISVNGAIDGAYDLTVSPAVALTINGAIGSVAPLASLTVNAPLSLAGSVTTSGLQTYNSPITLTANTALTMTGAGTLSLSNGVSGAYDLSLAGGLDNTFVLGGSLAVNNINVTGGSGSNTLNINNSNNQTWTIAGTDAGSVTGITDLVGILNFTSIQNWQSGTGTNTLVGGNTANTWVITGANSGTVTGLTNAFANFQNLVGGSSTDSFTLSGGSLSSGTIDGGLGVNSLTAGNTANTWLITDTNSGTVTGVSGGFSHIQSLIGGSSTDNFSLNGNTFNGSIAGGAGTNTLTANDTVNAWAITAANTGTVTGLTGGFSAIQSLVGGSNDDTFAFSAGGSVDSIDGGSAGVNSLDYSNYDTAVSLTIGGAATGVTNGYSNINRLVGSTVLGGTLTGGNVANTWNITSDNTGTVTGLANGFAQFSNLVGGTNNDTFIIANGAKVTGTINGGAGGVNTLNVSNYTTTLSMILSGASATGFSGITAGSPSPTGGFSNITQLVGASNATLTGLNTNSIWNITGNNSGTYNNGTYSLGFSNLPGITGNSANDNFIFANGQGMTGRIVGGSGTNTFDYSAYTTNVSMNLSTGAATGVGVTASGVSSVLGGSGVNTLTGVSVTNNTWNITSSNSGNITTTISPTVTFTNFANLVGGSANDNFVFSNGIGVTGYIDGAGGTRNTLSYAAYTTPVNVNMSAGTATGIAGGIAQFQGFTGGSASNTLTGLNTTNTWNITSSNSGNINSNLILFSAFGNLVGGSANDSFVLNSGVGVTGTLNGGAGVNTLNYSAYVNSRNVTVNLLTNTATNTAGISNFTNFVGGSGNNTLISGNGAHTWNVTGSNAGNIDATTTFSAFGNLTGGTGNDTFVFANGAGVTGAINGLTGTNALDYSAYTSAVNINLSNNTGTGLGSFANMGSFVGSNSVTNSTLTGANTANTWNITSNNAGTVGSLSFSKFGNLVGGNTTDSFIFSDGANVTGTINGAAGINTLNYNAYTTPVNVIVTNLTNINNVVGSATFAATNTLTGASGNNSWTLTGSNAGTVNGISFSNFGTWAGVSGSNNTLIAQNVNNTWNITGSNSGNLNNAITFSGFTGLTGNAANDDFVFSNNGSISGAIAGGLGTNSYNYSSLTNTNPISINLASGGISGISVFIGPTNIGSNNNTITAYNVTNTWNIGTNNAGTIASSGNPTITFTNFGNIVGGSGNDTFVFTNNATVNSMNGAGGFNTVDYSAITNTSPLTVNLGNGSINNMSGFIAPSGSIASNTIIGPNTTNAWTISANNAGNINNTITFSNFGNLTGGSGDDSFAFASSTPSIVGVISGGSGNNSLNYSAYSNAVPVTVNLLTSSATATGGISGITNFIGGYASNNALISANSANTWNITSANTGNINGSINFSKFGNLTGGSSTDSFVLSDGATLNLVNGGSGVNTLNYNAYTTPITINLAANTATGITNGFSNMAAFVGTSTPTNSTLIGANTANTWNITNNNAGNINSGSVTFSQFAQLNGGSANDSFIFTDGKVISGALSGGNGGVNTIDLSNYSSAVNVSLGNSNTYGYSGTTAGSVNPMSGFSAIMQINNGVTSTLTGNNNNSSWILSSNTSGTLNDGVRILTFSGFGTFNAGSGINSLTATNSNNTWNITGNNAGNINSAVNFSGMATLAGGSGDDAFVFSDGASISGLIKGNSGSNSFDYSAYSSPVQIGLNSNSATGTIGFSNISSFIGGSGSNTLTGANLNNTWNIDSDNNGTIVNSLNPTVTFTHFANIVGGSGNDTFVFTNNATVNSMNGAGGFNTIDYSAITNTSPLTVNLGNGSINNMNGFIAPSGSIASNTIIAPNTTNAWTISANNAGNINNAITFSNFGNLTGGSGDDSFAFASSTPSVAGVISGGAGNNTLNYSAYSNSVPVTINLLTSSATATGGISGITNFIGGYASNNTLVGTNAANTWNITGASEGNLNSTINFTKFGNLIGGTSTDSFVFSNGATINLISGGLGVNSLNFNAYTTPITVNVNNNSATGIANGFSNIATFIGTATPINSTLIGANVANTWNITNNNAGNINSGSVTFSQFGNLVGGTYNDTFIFSDGKVVSGTISGGNGGNNVLNFSSYTTPVNITLTGSNVFGHAGLTSGLINPTSGFSAITQIINGVPSSLIGNANDTRWILSSDTSGIVYDGVIKLAFTGFDILNGGAGANTLVGLNSNNTWNITGNNAGNINSVTNFTGMTNLSGGSANDSFIVNDGASISGLIQGGSGTNTFDYSAYTAPVTINYNTKVATGVGLFGGINNFIGGSASNTFIGSDNMTNTWNITGSDAGNLFNVGFLSATFSHFDYLMGGNYTDNFIFANGGAITGAIDGKEGKNTFDYGNRTTGSVTINLAQQSAANVAAVTNITAFIASLSTVNTIIGANTSNTWAVTSSNTGSINNTYTFQGFQNLIGGTNNDLFVFSNGAGVTGVVDGGLGSNTLNYDAYQTAVSVNSGAKTATGTGGYDHIDSFVGSRVTITP